MELDFNSIISEKTSNVHGFRRNAFSPAAVKQKAKEGLARLGGALFYPSVKRSPCAFGFCVWWV
jgi:hypothetical protein